GGGGGWRRWAGGGVSVWVAPWRGAGLVALRALADGVHGGDLVEVGLAVGEAGVGTGEDRAKAATATGRQQRLAAACRAAVHPVGRDRYAAVVSGRRPTQGDLAVASSSGQAGGCVGWGSGDGRGRDRDAR